MSIYFDLRELKRVEPQIRNGEVMRFSMIIVVLEMLRYTSIRTTQIYARITDQKISRDMATLAAKLNAVSPI